MFVIVVGVLLVVTFYVNLLFAWPELGEIVEIEHKTVVVTGKVKDKAFDDNGMVKSVTVGKTICYVNKTKLSNEPKLGANVKVIGDIKAIEGPMNPGEFNRKSYYGAKRIFYEMSADSVEVIREPALGVKEYFLKVRKNFSARIMRYFTLEGGTVNTLMCADKSFLSAERKDLYTRVGVGHFLVISGLHISAVGTFIYKILRRMGLSVRAGSISAMAFLMLYGCMVGFSVSVIRATIMFFVRLMADVLKRVYDMLNAVAVAALFSIVVNPLCIIDSAFIYSYVTVTSIAVYITYITKKVRKPKGIVKRMTAALKFPAVLWLFMMPVNLYISFGSSLMFIVANTLLAPMAAPILVLAFVGFGLSLAGLSLPTGLADFLIAIMLRGFDKLCKLIASAPVFLFGGRPELWKIGVYYVCVLWLMTAGRKSLGSVQRFGLMAGLILFAAMPANLSGRVTTLYVGQGECVVLHTGVGSAVVYDCGSTSKTGVGEYVLVPYLKATGVRRVEGIFISHGDMDHVGEVAYLCEALPREGIVLEHLYVQDIPDSAKSKALLEAERAAIGNNIPVTKLSRGQKVRKGEYSFTCLWPKKGSAPEDANAGSMVIMASGRGFDTLLMGDATGETERMIVKSATKAATGPIELLLVSHHGSDSASDPEFLEAVYPRTAVVTAGVNNRYGHPHREVLKRFKDICPSTRLYRTDRSGAVSIFMHGKKLAISPYLR